MNKKIIFILIFACISSIAKAQVKTYSGAYGSGGSATYTYIDGDDNRIFDGKFEYSSGNPPAITWSGNYKNDKKVGKWVCKWTMNHINRVITANYKDGLLNGSFEKVEKEPKTGNVKIIKATFTNNNLVGEFYTKTVTFASYKNPFSGKIEQSKTPEINEATRYFDQNGNADGSWILNETNDDGVMTTSVSEFKRGVLMKKYTVDESTGSRNVSIDNSDIVSRLAIGDEDKKSICLGETYYTFQQGEKSYNDIWIKMGDGYIVINFIDVEQFTCGETRGSQPVKFPSIKSIIFDEDMTREIEKKKREQEVLERKQATQIKLYNERKVKDYYEGIDYGLILKFMQKNASDNDFEIKKAQAIQYALNHINGVSENSRERISKRAEQDKFRIKEIENSYKSILPNATILVIPTKIALNNDDLVIQEAYVIYDNTGRDILEKYLRPSYSGDFICSNNGLLLYYDCDNRLSTNTYAKYATNNGVGKDIYLSVNEFAGKINRQLNIFTNGKDELFISGEGVNRKSLANVQIVPIDGAKIKKSFYYTKYTNTQPDLIDPVLKITKEELSMPIHTRLGLE